jgi:hypothetical protein
MTSHFGRDHADAIWKLLRGTGCRRFVIPAALKPEVRRVLRDDHGIWRGVLFPDSAGAAETAKAVFA